MANVTTTTAANLIPSRWTPSLKIDASEERVVTKFFNGGEGAGKDINGTMYIRRVAAIPGASQSGGTPTYTANTETRITVSPTWCTAAVQIEHNVFTQMDIGPDNAYRKHIAAGVAAFIDVQGANLASQLSTNISGGGGVNLDLTLLLDAYW